MSEDERPVAPDGGDTPNLAATVGSLTMRSPVMLASGTVGYGPEYAGLIDFTAVGALVTKTVTLRPWPGNAPPRLCETTGGMLNAIGLENVGMERFLSEKLPEAAALGVPLVASIAGTAPEEWADLAAAVGESPHVAAMELNVSCPNVERVHEPVWADPTAVEALTKAARRSSCGTLIVKLSPAAADVAEIARAAENGGADGVTVANTMPGMRIDLVRMKPALGNTTGGLSGRALLPINLALVWKVAERVSIPIVGCGGITTAEDALEYIAAGASAVQIGTAVFRDPGAPARITDGLAEELRSRDVDGVDNCVGIAREERTLWSAATGTD
jgi:dihydroorotate dehydrogenase (NAD+) catalytic subunit